MTRALDAVSKHISVLGIGVSYPALKVCKPLAIDVVDGPGGVGAAVSRYNGPKRLLKADDEESSP